MNCQEATLLISARIDDNLPGDRGASLDAHLAECEACRMTLTEMEQQDAALMRAFLPRQEAAAALADRVWQVCHGDERCAQLGLRARGFSIDAPIPPLAASQISESGERGFSTDGADRSAASQISESGKREFSTDGADRSATPQAAVPACPKKNTSALGVGYNPSVQRPTRFRKRFTFIAGWTAAAAAGFLAAMVVSRLAKPRPKEQLVVQTEVPLHHMLPPVARLTLATDEVFVCPSTEKTWRPISPGAPIDLLAQVRTADAKCELQLPDGSCVRLNSGTEARFTGDRAVSVSAGEVWSAVPRDGAPLCVSAGHTCVTAHGAGCAQGTQFDLARAADAATVTVQHGTADVLGNGPPTTVHGGQVLRAPSPSAVSVCVAAPGPLLSSRWQDELLVLKPGDDPEVAARVDQLLASIMTERGTSESLGATEQEVRASGQAWCSPFACYIRSQPPGSESRRTAARLLADLAPPSRIPDLIGLLTDDDSEVRYQAAVALRRLTGKTLGYPVDRHDPAAAAAWREWWERNKSRYPAGK